MTLRRIATASSSTDTRSMHSLHCLFRTISVVSGAKTPNTRQIRSPFVSACILTFPRLFDGTFGIRFQRRLTRAIDHHVEANEKSSREYQQSSGVGDEEREMHLGLCLYPQVHSKRRRQARHHFQQLPSRAALRDRVHGDVGQGRGAQIQRKQRLFGNGLWKILQCVHAGHHRSWRL